MQQDEWRLWTGLPPINYFRHLLSLLDLSLLLHCCKYLYASFTWCSVHHPVGSNSLPEGSGIPTTTELIHSFSKKEGGFTSSGNTISLLQRETLLICPFPFISFLSFIQVHAGCLWMPPQRLTAAHLRTLWLSFPVTGMNERDPSSSGVRSGFIAVSNADTLLVLFWWLVNW